MPTANTAWLYQLANERSLQLAPRKVGAEHAPKHTIRSLETALRYLAKRKQQCKGSKHDQRPEWRQRCAVRINYGRGGSIGKWYAVGRYVSRESATDAQTAFNADQKDIDMPGTMANWRKNGDDLFFKVIISPEFGYAMDLERLTKETMRGVEDQVGPLEWMAVQHHNTDNPHVHVLIRGVDESGKSIRFSRDFIQNGFRGIAENITTNHLGYRSEQQIIDAQRRETAQARYTDLDRKLKKLADVNGELMIPPPGQKEASSFRGITTLNLRKRLKKLEEMGLASSTGTKDAWRLDESLEDSLRAMQRTIDRQKMMSAHGVLSSDKSLPFRKLSFKDVQNVEGRILVHGHEEYGNGIRNYMLVESITGEVLQVPHVREIDDMRHHGRLEPGVYVRIKKAGDDPTVFSVQDGGEAESLLSNKEWLRANADRLEQAMPDGLGGWLGRLRAAAHEELRAEREQDLGHGR